MKKVTSPAGDMLLFDNDGKQIAIVGDFGFGAPAVVTRLEELIAFGVKQFISIGEAGALQPDMRVGDIVICRRAIRDEGTSYHYLKSSKYSFASKAMVRKISGSVELLGYKATTGTSWTTDAGFRETADEIRQYQSEGVATVEMEAAALFAVAQYYGVELGSVLSISDSIASLKWTQSYKEPENQAGLESLFKIAVAALTR